MTENENEQIDCEIELIRNRKDYLLYQDSLLIKFINGPYFKNAFQSITPEICTMCGCEYRLTHLCDSINKQVWIPDWQIPIFKLCEPYLKKTRKDLHESKKEVISEVKPKTLHRMEEKPSQLGEFCLGFSLCLFMILFTLASFFVGAIKNAFSV